MTEPYGVADLLARQRKGIRVIFGNEISASVAMNVPFVATLWMIEIVSIGTQFTLVEVDIAVSNSIGIIVAVPVSSEYDTGR